MTFELSDPVLGECAICKAEGTPCIDFGPRDELLVCVLCLERAKIRCLERFIHHGDCKKAETPGFLTEARPEPAPSPAATEIAERIEEMVNNALNRSQTTGADHAYHTGRATEIRFDLAGAIDGILPKVMANTDPIHGVGVAHHPIVVLALAAHHPCPSHPKNGTHQCVRGALRCAHCGRSIYQNCNGCGRYMTADEICEYESRCARCC